MEEFLRLLEEASVVRTDGTGQAHSPPAPGARVEALPEGD